MALAAVGLLAACGKSQDGATGAAPPPADAPADAPISSPGLPPPPASVASTAEALNPGRAIDAVGTEPFWALQIRPETLNFSTPDKPMRRAKNTGLSIEPGKVAWMTTLPGGGAIKATVTVKTCSDGMSDRRYPFTVLVEAEGKTLNGCAAYADAPTP
jgi:uncharacterized membrane protein